MSGVHVYTHVPCWVRPGRDAMPWAILFLVDGRHEGKKQLEAKEKGDK